MRAQRRSPGICVCVMFVDTTLGIHAKSRLLAANGRFLARIPTRLGAHFTTRRDEADYMGPKAPGPFWGSSL